MIQLPQRKPARLKSFDYSQSGTYFITICTLNRRHLLGRIVGDAAHSIPEIQLSNTGITVEKYLTNIPSVYQHIKLDCYTIMPNHIHFVLSILIGSGGCGQPHPTALPTIINSFKTLVSKECGQSIWQRSLYDPVIRNEQDLLHIWEYIETNPLKWAEDCFYEINPAHPPKAEPL